MNQEIERLQQIIDQYDKEINRLNRKIKETGLAKEMSEEYYHSVLMFVALHQTRNLIEFLIRMLSEKIKLYIHPVSSTPCKKGVI